MKIIFTTLVVSFSFFFTSYCQSFVRGYVITIKGDTISGFIKNKESGPSQTLVYFKREQSSESIIYKTNDLKRYYLTQENEYYVSASVDVDMKSVETTQLEVDDPNPKFIKETVFLKLITKGKATLYSFYDTNNKEHFFIELEGQGIEELQRIIYLRNRSYSSITKDIYKQQLSNVMTDCGINFKNIYFSTTGLKKVFTKYNECNGISTYVEKKNKGSISLYALAGIALGSGNYGGLSYDANGYSGTVQDAKFSSSTDPTFAIGIETYSKNRTMSFGTEINWKSHTFKGSSFTNTNTVLAEIGYNLYKLNLIVTYHFNSSLKPFLRFGPGFSIISQTKNQLTTTQYPPYNGPINKQFNSLLGVMAATGIEYNNVILEIRYEYNPLTAERANFYPSDLIFQIGYRIIKRKE